MNLLNNTICIIKYNSPCGVLILGSFGDKLCLCDWQEGKHRSHVHNRLKKILDAEFSYRHSAVLDAAVSQLDEYFNGRRTVFSIPLLFIGTDFQKLVWNTLLTIPYGKTISYGDLARIIGHPSSVRAVANANGANAISIFAPCHRVIGSNGSLTGYGGGLHAKKYLLATEAILDL